MPVLRRWPRYQREVVDRERTRKNPKWVIVGMSLIYRACGIKRRGCSGGCLEVIRREIIQCVVSSSDLISAYYKPFFFI